MPQLLGISPCTWDHPKSLQGCRRLFLHCALCPRWSKLKKGPGELKARSSLLAVGQEK